MPRHRPLARPGLAAVFALALLAASPAAATLIDLTASLDCAQANAGAGTCGAGGSGTGTATIVLDSDTNSLSWNIEWSGVSSAPTLMHFHGPALTTQNAGVQVNVGVVGPPVIGAAVLSDQQESDLLAGLWYLNLHTTNFPAGEIRGQVTVVPEPGTLLLVGAGLVLAARARRTPSAVAALLGRRPPARSRAGAAATRGRRGTRRAYRERSARKSGPSTGRPVWGAIAAMRVGKAEFDLQTCPLPHHPPSNHVPSERHCVLDQREALVRRRRCGPTRLSTARSTSDGQGPQSSFRSQPGHEVDA